MKKSYQTPQIMPVLICMQDILTGSDEIIYEDPIPGENELEPDFLT